MRQIMKNLRAPLLAVALATVLPGCTIGPDYLRPLFETPANWRVDYPQAAQLTNLRWWEQFQDPVLNQLVETALRQNQDIRIAAERVEQFLGQLQTTRSQFFPQVGYGLDVSRNRATEVGYTPLPQRHGSVVSALPGHGERQLADRSLRTRTATKRSRAGARLRQRAGTSRHAADRRFRRRRGLHHAAFAGSPA